jgi:hypothetical protein
MPFRGCFKSPKNLRFAHASAKADAYNLLTSVGASFSWRGREAAFATFETASFRVQFFLCKRSPFQGGTCPDLTLVTL